MVGTRSTASLSSKMTTIPNFFPHLPPESSKALQQDLIQIHLQKNQAQAKKTMMIRRRSFGRVGLLAAMAAMCALPSRKS
jgi:hypothetical protein